MTLTATSGRFRLAPLEDTKTWGTREIVALMGPPGSGKSTLAKQLGLPIVTTDAIRSLGRDAIDRVYDDAFASIAEILKANGRVVFDATLANPKTRAHVLRVAHTYHARATLVALTTPLRVCIDRQAGRSSPVPPSKVTALFSVLQTEYERVEGEGWERVYWLDGSTRSYRLRPPEPIPPTPMPSTTLGWGVLNWIARYLPHPADPLKPFILTDEEAKIVLRWYAVDSDTGEYLHRRAELEMAKGWGKSPFAGALALAEFVGPVVFDHWDKGEPVGRPWYNPWVQIAAVSEDQTDNTYHALYEMLVANDHRAAKELGIDDGRTRLYLKGRPGVLEPVTASAGSREGQRLTFAVLDETHLWNRRNGGVRLAGTLRRNAAKMGGRTFETTNAPTLGEKSVAEQSALDPGVMRYSRRPKVQPDSDWSDEKLIAALDEAYGDASWIDRRRLLAEIRDPATNWDDALRYYFNIRTTGAGRAVDPLIWDALAKSQDVPAGTRIGLGFDGSISRDATVLRACTADGYHFLIRKWERPKGVLDWHVDRSDVNQTIVETFANYDVGLMICDPPMWTTEIMSWAEAFGEERVIELYTNQARRFAPAVDRWLTAIREGTLTHDGDPFTAENVKSAHLQKVRLTDSDDDARTMYVMIRGEDNRRIDAAVADVLAHEAAMTMPKVEPLETRPMIRFE